MLSQECIKSLEGYAFPRNVRELEQLMDRVAVKASGRPIPDKVLRSELLGRSKEHSTSFEQWARMPFHESVARWEKHLIEAAMQESGGNKAEAARLLGVQRRLLYEKLQQFDLNDYNKDVAKSSR